MNPFNQSQTGVGCRWARPALWMMCAAALTLEPGGGVGASEAAGFKPVRVPGGISPQPHITSMARTNNQVTVTWSGFSGPYQVERCSGIGGTWTQVGEPGNAKTMTLPLDDGLGFLRVTGGNPNYTGAETCQDCHSQTHGNWAQTAHAGAFQSLKAIRQDKNPACLACHTVGYGFATGFKDEATTPYFSGVQCENCHGPAADHANKPSDPLLRPVKTLSATMCGGCHTDAHHPTYDEWENSKHAEVTPATATYFRSSTAEARMLSCGACHSGAVRLAMLKAKERNQSVTLPVKEEAATTGITCAVCHEPHLKTAHGRQLRNPVHSNQAFSYSTSTNTTFAAQYDANLNICGQCHNARGATWKDTGRAPHHSPQYNILTATMGFLVGTNAARQSAHATQIVNQCTHCHTHAHPVENPTENNPNYTGHEFKPHLASCQPCPIDEADAAFKIESTQADIKKRIANVKTLLDQWATTASDPALRTKYGTLAWEYNTIGDVTDPAQVLGAKGPTTAEQNVVPDEIKQARFNLYLVAHDLSYGVHNTKYAQDLLKTASDLVRGKLAPAAAKPASFGGAGAGSAMND
ncbi:MAG: hypothetical protein FJ398_10990 [Verrucomicrobia bacterium]|nr:hypothetical protein [Verrucomicrobiota bacterium]